MWGSQHAAGHMIKPYLYHVMRVETLKNWKKGKRRWLKKKTYTASLVVTWLAWATSRARHCTYICVFDMWVFGPLHFATPARVPASNDMVFVMGTSTLWWWQRGRWGWHWRCHDVNGMEMQLMKRGVSCTWSDCDLYDSKGLQNCPQIDE